MATITGEHLTGATTEERYMALLAEWPNATRHRQPDSHERALLYLVAACPRLLDGPIELSFNGGFHVLRHPSAAAVLSSGERLIYDVALHLFNDSLVRKVSVDHLCSRLDAKLFRAVLTAMQIRACEREVAHV